MNRPAFSIVINNRHMRLEFQQDDLNSSALAFRCRAELLQFVGRPQSVGTLKAAEGAVNYVIDSDLLTNRLYLEPYDCKWISLR